MSLSDLSFGYRTSAREAPTLPAVTPLYEPPFSISNLNRNFEAVSGRLNIHYRQLLGPNRANQWAIRPLRATSRWLAENDVYISRWLEILRINVIGSEGIRLEAKITDGITGNYAYKTNTTLEKDWAEWCNAASVDGLWTFADIEQQAIRNTACDGEIFVRMMYGPKLNRWGFGLSIIDADLLDERNNATGLKNGNSIVQGIEVNALGQRQAYWFYNRHPDDTNTGLPLQKIRVPADEVLHIYRPSRPNQFHGIPWATPAFVMVAQVHEYTHAELVAAQAAANNIGSIETDLLDTTAYTKPPERVTLDSAAGQLLKLAPGERLEWTPATRPPAAFASFVTTLLHSIAAALNCPYSSLTTDVSLENYSSGRVSVIEARDYYKNVAAWLVRMLHDKVYEAWLTTSLENKAIQLPTDNPADYFDVEFRSRSWKWADPLKDLKGYEMAIQNNLISKAQVASEMGLNFRDVAQARYEEQKLEAQYRQRLVEVDGLGDYLIATLLTDDNKITVTEADPASATSAGAKKE
ncbi:MAG TPA: phage portal protein [Gemmatimonadales bacterium]|jgi:lambda family phage portal protein